MWRDVRLLGYYSAPQKPARGLVIMLHGWEGSAEANYVLSVGGALYAAGFAVFRLNFGTTALPTSSIRSCFTRVASMESSMQLNASPRHTGCRARSS